MTNKRLKERTVIANQPVLKKVEMQVLQTNFNAKSPREKLSRKEMKHFDELMADKWAPVKRVEDVDFARAAEATIKDMGKFFS